MANARRGRAGALQSWYGSDLPGPLRPSPGAARPGREGAARNQRLAPPRPDVLGVGPGASVRPNQNRDREGAATDRSRSLTVAVLFGRAPCARVGSGPRARRAFE